MDPYRISSAEVNPPPRWWKRFTCWLSRHDWEITRDAGADLAHLHLLAGCDAKCLRCGATWFNYDDFMWVRKHGFGILKFDILDDDSVVSLKPPHHRPAARGPRGSAG